jgi:hypothetical protein
MDASTNQQPEKTAAPEHQESSHQCEHKHEHGEGCSHGGAATLKQTLCVAKLQFEEFE